MCNYSGLSKEELIERLEKSDKTNGHINNEAMILAKNHVPGGIDKIVYHARCYDYNTWLVRDTAITYKKQNMSKDEMVLFFNKLLDLGYLISIV